MTNEIEMQIAATLAECTTELGQIGLSNEEIASVLRARADLIAARRPETEAAEREADAARRAQYNAAMAEERAISADDIGIPF